MQMAAFLANRLGTYHSPAHLPARQATPSGQVRGVGVEKGGWATAGGGHVHLLAKLEHSSSFFFSPSNGPGLGFALSPKQKKKKNRIKQQCQGRRPSAAVSVTGSSDPGGLSAMGTQPLHCGVLKKSRLIFYTFFFCFFCSWRQQAKKVACAGVSSTICAHVVSCRH